jgi:DNA-binding CsgD family transcriptional regulator
MLCSVFWICGVVYFAWRLRGKLLNGLSGFLPASVPEWGRCPFMVENLFPGVLRRALKTLADEQRQLIVSLVALKGPASLSEIAEALNMQKKVVHYHLRQLVAANIPAGLLASSSLW